MTILAFRLDVDQDGVATVTWDMPGRSMNVFDLAAMDELGSIVERIATEATITGAIITSGKETFSGGADLNMLDRLLGDFRAAAAAGHREAAIERLYAETFRLGDLFRRLETCGKPVVAAINGTCLGGAFELALACHGRIAADHDKVRVGLPEVRVGLLPGAGGTQRVARLVNTQDALTMLLKGEALRPSKAKALGLLDAVVPADDLLPAARRWLRETPRKVARWDEDGFKGAGPKVFSPQGFAVWPAVNAHYRKETFDNYPGARALLSAVFEGLQLPFDQALKVEQRYFAQVIQTDEAAAMIRSLFVSLQELNKLARRPAEVAPTALRKVAILGAGFMGAGIAAVAARAGLAVALLDRDAASAAKGKETVAASLQKAVSRGKLADTDRAATLARIEAGDDFAALADADLVIEAVFEDRATKEAVIARAFAAMRPDAVLGSNTSTLPITSLAAAAPRPRDVIGIHFFSPVEKMMLVEVILAKKTSDRALAAALDFVRLIRKTPIVVNDSRGFYTSRVVTTYIAEGHLMLAEGVPPAMIENAARMAGMPVGPLALNDEVAIDLTLRIMDATRKDLGETAVPEAPYRLIAAMVNDHGRLGRKNGKGFYDYPDSPAGRKRLWPGLADIYAPRADVEAIGVAELKERFLAIMALETARCYEERVLTDVREADVGSILGYGFPPFTGGTLSYIDFLGPGTFVRRLAALTRRHGARFRPNRLLRELARSNETFYGRFGPPRAAADGDK
ncbi:MAG: enoyl-CoA hydratase/isomerase family protein [Bauldia sp.]|nr:enoyl-CoA hydratase/isomerase family protein [Bauldia sp.]